VRGHTPIGLKEAVSGHLPGAKWGQRRAAQSPTIRQLPDDFSATLTRNERLDK
jgi:hypothetical protein